MKSLRKSGNAHLKSIEAPPSKEEVCQFLVDGSHAIVRTFEGTIAAWTAGAAAIYGWNAEEAVGRRSHVLLETVFPAPLETINAELGQNGFWTGELTHKTKHKETIVVQSSWKMIAGTDGSQYVVEINNDITTLALARDRLEDSERRLRLAQEVARFGAWDWDASTDTAICSDEWFRQYGRRPQHIGPHHEQWLSWIHADDRDRVVRALRMATETGSLYAAEYRVVWPNGQTRWLQAKAQPTLNFHGKCIRMIGANIDVTERRVFEEQLQQNNRSLQQSNEDLKQFAYAIGHDLKEPLRAVSAFSSILANRLVSTADAESQTYLAHIQQSATRMQNMIEGLLEYAKASEQDLPKKRVGAETLVQTAISNLQAAVADAQAQIRIGTLPELNVNPAAVVQVFQNLIGNAVKYRRLAEPACIQISAEQSNGNWIFSVADNGVGFEPLQSEGIFQLFRRINPQKTSGMGVGLAVARRVIERHGGRMWAESQPDLGSTFYFSIPIQSAESEPQGFDPQI